MLYRHKYHARRTEVDGIVFDSKAEARRYGELKLLEKAGRITNLGLQPEFPIGHKGVKICKVILDFEYLDSAGKDHFEDVKSPATDTAISRLKRKLLRAFYGVEVELVWSGRQSRAK